MRTTSFVPTVPAGIVRVTDVAVFEALVAAVPPIVEAVRLERFVQRSNWWFIPGKCAR